MELRITDLAVARAAVPVLEGVSFRLGAGQALVLRGPNGIGKSTLLEKIGGMSEEEWMARYETKQRRIMRNKGLDYATRREAKERLRDVEAGIAVEKEAHGSVLSRARRPRCPHRRECH